VAHTTNVGTDLLKAVAKRLRDQGLREVEVQDQPLTEDQIRPGIYVTPPTPGNGRWDQIRDSHTNERDDIAYGCQVTVVGGSLVPFNQQSDDRIDVRQLVRRRFHNKRLELLPEELRDMATAELGCTVTEGEFKWSPDQPNVNKFDITVLVVRCWIREPRIA
jgi:hypothetical protein